MGAPRRRRRSRPHSPGRRCGRPASGRSGAATRAHAAAAAACQNEQLPAVQAARQQAAEKRREGEAAAAKRKERQQQTVEGLKRGGTYEEPHRLRDELSIDDPTLGLDEIDPCVSPHRPIPTPPTP